MEMTLRMVRIGGEVRILAMARGINDRKAAEAALRRANEELEQRVSERTAELAAINDALAQEMTERGAAERALREREEHFRRLIENSSDQVMIVDTAGAITYVGPSVERLLGYHPDELLTLGPNDLVHPDDIPAVMGSIAQVAAHPGETFSIEYRIRHKDGSWRFFENVARTLASDSADAGLVANARDITERKRAEQAMAKSEEHFRRIIESASDWVMICDQQGAITYVGPSSERMLGYAPDEVLGCTPDRMLHPDDAPIAMRDLQWLLAHPGESIATTLRIQHRDGSWRVFEYQGRTLSPDSGDDGVISFARDITERKAAEAALARAKEEAERANRAKSEFLEPDEPRAANADEQHPRLRTAAGARRTHATAVKVGAAHPQGRSAPAHAHQRSAGDFAHRGGARAPLARAGRAGGGDAGGAWAGAPAGVATRRRVARRDAHRAAPSCTPIGNAWCRSCSTSCRTPSSTTARAAMCA